MNYFLCRNGMGDTLLSVGIVSEDGNWFYGEVVDDKEDPPRHYVSWEEYQENGEEGLTMDGKNWTLRARAGRVPSLIGKWFNDLFPGQYADVWVVCGGLLEIEVNLLKSLHSGCTDPPYRLDGVYHFPTFRKARGYEDDDPDVPPIDEDTPFALRECLLALAQYKIMAVEA